MISNTRQGDSLANTKNLKHGNPETQFTSGQSAVENGSKGGKATAKRKKAIKSMQEAAQALLSGTYTDDDGKELTGYELMMAKLFKIATDENKRDCLSAMRLIREITGENITADERRLLEKKIESLTAQIELSEAKKHEIEF
jgi:hypothetical protein